MPVTKMRFSCGHKGHGASCNRCKEAARMEALAEGKVRPASGDKRRSHEGQAGFDGWKPEHFTAEAERLKAIPGRS